MRGKSIPYPQELKGAIMRQSDYTTKTPGSYVNNEGTGINQQRFQGSLEAANRTCFEAYTQLGVIDQQLAQYNEVDWNTWAS